MKVNSSSVRARNLRWFMQWLDCFKGLNVKTPVEKMRDDLLCFLEFRLIKVVLMVDETAQSGSVLLISFTEQALNLLKFLLSEAGNETW